MKDGYDQAGWASRRMSMSRLLTTRCHFLPFPVADIPSLKGDWDMGELIDINAFLAVRREVAQNEREER
jgi:hypothetical protein